MDGINVSGQGANIGVGQVTDFATQVADKKRQIDQIEQELTGPGASNLTMEQLDSLVNQLTTLKSELETLKSECPEDDTTDMTQIEDMEVKIGSLVATAIALESGESTIDTSKKDSSTTYPGSGDPQILSGSTDNVSLQDEGNLWLSTGLMAILWKVEAAMIHQSVENMDQERICKIHGYENIMSFGNAEAAAAYQSDMDQSKMYMTEYHAAIAQAVVTGVTALGGVMRQGKIERENEQLRDNPSYTSRLNDLRANKNITAKDRALMLDKNGKYDPKSDYYQKPLPKVFDKQGHEIKPGRKQIQEEEEYAKTYPYDPIVGKGSTTTISAQNPNHPERLKDQQKIKQAQDDNRVAIETSHYRLTNDLELNMWRQSLPELGQSIIQAYQAHTNYEVTMDKAQADYQKILWDAALQNAQSFLDGADKCFQSEMQNVQQIIEFLIDAAQKNTQWASVRA